MPVATSQQGLATTPKSGCIHLNRVTERPLCALWRRQLKFGVRRPERLPNCKPCDKARLLRCDQRSGVTEIQVTQVALGSPRQLAPSLTAGMRARHSPTVLY